MRHTFKFEQTNFVNTATCTACGRHLVNVTPENLGAENLGVAEIEDCPKADSYVLMLVPNYVVDFLESLGDTPIPVNQWLDSARNLKKSSELISQRTEKIYGPLQGSGEPYM